MEPLMARAKEIAEALENAEEECKDKLEILEDLGYKIIAAGYDEERDVDVVLVESPEGYLFTVLLYVEVHGFGRAEIYPVVRA